MMYFIFLSEFAASVKKIPKRIFECVVEVLFRPSFLLIYFLYLLILTFFKSFLIHLQLLTMLPYLRFPLPLNFPYFLFLPIFILPSHCFPPFYLRPIPHSFQLLDFTLLTPKPFILLLFGLLLPLVKRLLLYFHTYSLPPTTFWEHVSLRTYPRYL